MGKDKKERRQRRGMRRGVVIGSLSDVLDKVPALP
jgi:hypothetical protein